MKTFFLVALSLTIAVSCAQAAAPRRPNIVLIFADDLGWKDVGQDPAFDATVEAGNGTEPNLRKGER